MAVTPRIVTLNTTVTQAPTPSTLQQSGALISIGGSTLTTGTYQYCSTLAAITAILSSEGNYEELSNMATTFFAQGQTIGVYVLEIGSEGSGSAGITALNTWITANPGIFYAYLTPAVWDTSGAALNTMAANYSSPTSFTYFFVTTTVSTITAYAVTTKAIVATVPSPTAAGTEFQAAALFYNWLVNNASAGNPVPPMGYRFVYGVTPWPAIYEGASTAANIQTILTAFGNVILTGAEGGISTACIFKGTTMDGQQMVGGWYGIDWFQINSNIALANAFINAANANNPLDYNQAGINTIETVANGVASQGVTLGLLLSAPTPTTQLPNGTPYISAVPFSTYTNANPGAYKAGSYGGLSATITGQNGFLTIVYNINVTQFA